MPQNYETYFNKKKTQRFITLWQTLRSKQILFEFFYLIFWCFYEFFYATIETFS